MQYLNINLGRQNAVIVRFIRIYNNYYDRI
jgi:hypothetical protein